MIPQLPVHGVHHLALRVTDLERSRRFYADTLGLAVMLEGEGFCIVNTNGTALGLRGPTTECYDKFDPFRVGLDHLAFRVSSRDDIEAIQRQLDAAGVRNNGIEIDDVLGGTFISFYDPDGIAWEAYYLPSYGAG